VHIWVIWYHIWDTWCHISCCTLMWYHTWCHLWYHIWNTEGCTSHSHKRGSPAILAWHCKIRRRADLLDFHPLFLKCRRRGLFVRSRLLMIAYSYSAWTTNTKTSLTAHKSDNTQICPQILTIPAPMSNNYIRAYLKAVGHKWLHIPTQHERLIASNCINRTVHRFLTFQPLFLTVTWGLTCKR